MITVEFDTTDKKLVVKQDGKKLSGVKYVRFSPNYEYVNSEYVEKDMCCEIGMMEENAEAGTKKTIYLTASEYLNSFLESK